MKIRRCCIDSGGHHTTETMKFAKRKKLLGIVSPIKGSSTPIPTTIKQSKKRSKLYIIDTTALKDSMYADLRVETVGAPGHQSFYSDIDPDFFTQLMSEKKVKTGLQRKYEVAKGVRNEVCDMYCYCRAAIRIFSPKIGEIEAFSNVYKEAAEAAPEPLRPRVTFEETPEEEVTPIPEPAVPHPPRNRVQPRVRSIRNPRERKPPMGF